MAQSRTVRRLSADERRSQIVEAARRLFSTNPAGSVSMERVAAEAGVATGLIYHYFRNRDDLRLAVMRAMFRSAPPIPEHVATATREERLAESTDAWLDMVWDNRETWLALMGAEGLGRDPDVEALLDRVREQTVDNIIAVLGIGPVGDVPPETRAVLRAYGGFAEAATREWLESGRLTRMQIHALLTSTLLLLVDQAIPAVTSTAP